jgi:hypothetical protein
VERKETKIYFYRLYKGDDEQGRLRERRGNENPPLIPLYERGTLSPFPRRGEFREGAVTAGVFKRGEGPLSTLPLPLLREGDKGDRLLKTILKGVWHGRI